MAYGSELYLGLVGEQPMRDTLKSLGLTYKQYKGIEVPATLADQLKQAHKAALEAMGLKVHPASAITLSNGRTADDGYVYVEGLDGKVRQTCTWSLEVDYDPDEMGHEPEDMLVGVSLISRYFPVFLDWDKDHGGSGDGIVLTPETLKNIEIARKHIAPILPFIQTAPIIFRERHY